MNEIDMCFFQDKLIELEKRVRKIEETLAWALLDKSYDERIERYDEEYP